MPAAKYMNEYVITYLLSHTVLGVPFDSFKALKRHMIAAQTEIGAQDRRCLSHK